MSPFNEGEGYDEKFSYPSIFFARGSEKRGRKTQHVGKSNEM